MRLSEFKLRAEIAHDSGHFFDLFGDRTFLLEICQGDPELVTLKADATLPGIFVGRSPACQVVLVRDQVSTVHAQLIPPSAPDEPWHIIDLGSTNGTRLGEEPLEPLTAHPLEGNCALHFGSSASFRFLTPSDLLEHLKPRVAGERRSEDLFLCSDMFSPIRLVFDRPVVLGRSPVASVVLPHKEVSRRHVEIERCPEGLYVRDLDSSNGTFLGDERIDGRARRAERGDRLCVGPFVFVIRGAEEMLEAGANERDMLETTQTIRGDLSDLPLAELLRAVLDKERSGVLEVRAHDRSGRLTFHDGVVSQAETESGLEGTLAVRELLQARDGTFTLHSDEGGEHEAEPRLTTYSQENRLLERMFFDNPLETSSWIHD